MRIDLLKWDPNVILYLSACIFPDSFHHSVLNLHETNYIWFISLNTMPSCSNHVVDGRASCFSDWIIFYCVCTFSWSTQLLMDLWVGSTSLKFLRGRGLVCKTGFSRNSQEDHHAQLWGQQGLHIEKLFQKQYCPQTHETKGNIHILSP